MAFYTEIPLDPAPEAIVTLAEFKQQIKELEPEEAHPEDAIWQIFLDAAIEESESYINRAIITRKYKITGKSFEEVVVQSLHTIQSIDKISYKPENYTSGELTELPAENYSLQRVDNVENQLVYAENVELPKVKEYTPDAVVLEITVGLKTIPKKVKQAVLLKAAAMDKYRADYVKNKPTASEKLLNKLIKY